MRDYSQSDFFTQDYDLNALDWKLREERFMAKALNESLKMLMTRKVLCMHSLSHRQNARNIYLLLGFAAC